MVTPTSWGLISVAQNSAGQAMAVGYSLDPTTEPVAEFWNGSSWTATPMPHPGGGALLYSVTAVPGTDEFLAAGESCTGRDCPSVYMLEWNGTTWSQVTLPAFTTASDLDAVSASSATDAWAVGGTCNYKSYRCKALILHWNGTSWSKSSIPSRVNDLEPTLFTVSDVSPTDAWAGGSDFNGALALHWNGHSWTSVKLPTGAGFTEGIDGIAAIPGTSEIWALVEASGGTLMLKWNGTKWHAYNLQGNTQLESVDAVAASSVSNAWDVGWSYSRSEAEPSLTVRWNGRSWTNVKAPSPHPVDELFGVSASSNSDAIAAGVGLSPLESTAKGLVLSWSGTAWSKVTLPNPSVPSGSTPRAGLMTEAHKF